LNPEPDSSARAGRCHERALTCGFTLPLVTARDRREPEVAGVMRTQRGPAPLRHAGGFRPAGDALDASVGACQPVACSRH